MHAIYNSVLFNVLSSAPSSWFTAIRASSASSSASYFDAPSFTIISCAWIHDSLSVVAPNLTTSVSISLYSAHALSIEAIQAMPLSVTIVARTFSSSSSKLATASSCCSIKAWINSLVSYPITPLVADLTSADSFITNAISPCGYA